MPRPVNIVTTCSDRKRAVGVSPILLRQVPAGDVIQRVARWHGLLRHAKNLFAARDVYRGEHWSVARQIPERGRELGFQPSLWVCSAGYGLIHADTEIAPYGATFTRGHPDSVGKPKCRSSTTSDARAWWSELCKRSEVPGLEALAARRPLTPLLVAVSATYLNAIAEDLLAASRRLRSPELLMIIAAGVDKAPAGLEDNLLPAGAEFSSRVGGTLGSLNIRLALEALRWAESGDLDADYLRERFGERLRRMPAFSRPEGRSLSDLEVVDFINRNFKIATSHTGMLRQLRDSGLACEQGRFRELYVATVGQEHAERGSVT
jgi:hypothetical protein